MEAFKLYPKQVASALVHPLECLQPVPYGTADVLRSSGLTIDSGPLADLLLTEPQNALIKQYIALMDTEGIKLTFSYDAVQEVARFAATVNENTENIGARRLHTIMEKLLDEISFEGPDLKKKTIRIDAAYVQKMLADIVKDQDLSRYIL